MGWWEGKAGGRIGVRGDSESKAEQEGQAGGFGRCVAGREMDCLWERDVCQPGATVIGNGITTEMEIKRLRACLFVYACAKGELSE